MVHVNDILDFLVAKSCAPSTFGAQLERLKYGLHSSPDPFKARSDVEDGLLATAVLIRCIDDFSRRDEFTASRKVPTSYKMLSKLQERITPKTPQGAIALGILRAYHEWSTQSQERGLTAVYQYLASIAPSTTPSVPKDQRDILQAFRTGEAKRARNYACESYADSLLALQQHVRIFNDRETRRGA